MRNIKLVLFALIAMMLFTLPVFASDGDLFSVYNSSGNQVRITSTGAYLGGRTSYEVITTDDTVTAADSGTTFFINNADDPVTMTLPTAAAGLTYKFVSINGNADNDTRTILNPQSKFVKRTECKKLGQKHTRQVMHLNYHTNSDMNYVLEN
jgi:hypothetical protein